ncbi:hypothetical protein BJ138DRAFT_1118810 [Hygrophoropsis aurantiaca]|uniref:Uncharacterized protein n=1 Tax=Hygrophoropsis aurantiaca TaxID=72124 RepID=A0ACB7ZWK6_9AGAM|nr:hypothetical protein BJ138DRAFT_1118810 [Hygrophoropsis aurantiaca]
MLYLLRRSYSLLIIFLDTLAFFRTSSSVSRNVPPRTRCFSLYCHILPPPPPRSRYLSGFDHLPPRFATSCGLSLPPSASRYNPPSCPASRRLPSSPTASRRLLLPRCLPSHLTTPCHSSAIATSHSALSLLGASRRLPLSPTAS